MKGNQMHSGKATVRPSAVAQAAAQFTRAADVSKGLASSVTSRAKSVGSHAKFITSTPDVGPAHAVMCYYNVGPRFTVGLGRGALYV